MPMLETPTKSFLCDVWTFGYGGRNWESLTTLDAWLKEHDALLIDVRMAPTHFDDWSKGKLWATLGGRYAWLQWWGNTLHASGGLSILDWEKGLVAFHGLQNSWKTVVLLCGCADRTRCHRCHLAKQLGELGYNDCGDVVLGLLPWETAALPLYEDMRGEPS